MSGYDVAVYDCAGEFTSRTVPAFSEALPLYREYRAKYRGKVVLVTNLDRCDYDTDGLTDDEREALETVDAVRAVAR